MQENISLIKDIAEKALRDAYMYVEEQKEVSWLKNAKRYGINTIWKDTDEGHIIILYNFDTEKIVEISRVNKKKELHSLDCVPTVIEFEDDKLKHFAYYIKGISYKIEDYFKYIDVPLGHILMGEEQKKILEALQISRAGKDSRVKKLEKAL